jgi:hypothetical protein
MGVIASSSQRAPHSRAHSAGHARRALFSDIAPALCGGAWFSDTAAAHRGGAWLACGLLIAAAWNGALVSRAAADQCGDIAKKADCPQALAAESARGLGLGTGSRASAISTSALAYSPAALALGNLYHIEGNVDYLGDLHAVALGGAVVDSSTSKIGAGLGLRGFLSGDNRIGGIDGRLGIALALSEAFSVGLLGRYVNISSDNPPIDVSGFTMDASLRVAPTEGLQFDIGAMNFIDRDNPYLPFMLRGSVAVGVAQALSIGADVLSDMTSFDKPQLILGGGIEYLGGNSVPLRLGYSADLGRKFQFLGVGIGYTDQRIGLDLGLKQEIVGGHDTRVMGAVRYYVN